VSTSGCGASVKSVERSRTRQQKAKSERKGTKTRGGRRWISWDERRERLYGRGGRVVDINM